MYDSTTPLDVEPRSSEKLFRLIMCWTGAIASVGHLLLVLVFALANISPLVWLHLFSMLLYVCATISLVRGVQPAVWLYLMVIETLFDSLLSCYWIGVDSGLFYYALLLPPCLTLADIRPLRVKLYILTATMGFVLAGNLWLHSSVPVVPINQTLLRGLDELNLLVFLILLSVIATLYYRMVGQSQDTLHAMASTDALTGLLNRRSLLANWHTDQARSDSGLTAVLLCDLDHFKQINDSLGHEAGDIVLRRVSNLLRDGVRDTDHVARWGGEEFLALLSGASYSGAETLAAHLLASIANERFQIADQSLNITVTIGVACQQSGEPLDRVIARADEALYRGKQAGRDRVQF